MSRRLDEKIDTVKQWLNSCVDSLIQMNLEIKNRSDTPAWYAVDIFDEVIALSIDVNNPGFAPYYSVAIECYNFRKEEDLIYYWYDSEATSSEELDLVLASLLPFLKTAISQINDMN